METPAVAQLLYLFDSAFQGTDWHSLLGNLKPVTPEDWTWVPPGGDRSIQSIVQHVGGCKYMYDNHAFGDARLTWEDPLVEGDEACATFASAIDWLREGHERLRTSLAALDDAELLKPRMTNWGEPKETRWIIATMIEHDLYHAGEINHLRSLRQQSDRWAYG
ncbi:MAG: DinB family protein [Chloroflexia bacterium]